MGVFTVKEYQRELEKRAKQAANIKVLAACVGTVHAKQIERVFDRGLNANGVKHGNYSTKPIYLNAKFSARKSFKPVGKTGKSTFTNGKSHKTKYFQGGYRQFKSEAIGTSKVNFQVFGDLRNDWTNSLQVLNNKWITGTKRINNSNKVDGLIAKFGVSSFQISNTERKIFLKCASKKMTTIINGNA